MFELYGCPTHYGVGAKGLIKSIDYLTCEGIAKQGYHILTSGHRPLMIAGDHSAAMGSVSATSVYTKGETGLIWIDAHPDINTDKTTVTGNIHGMPVAALLGLGEPSLTHFLDPKLMPGVSVPVPEGFNEDDVFMMMDELLTRLPIQAMDIVEFNHELDKDDITAGFVSRLVEHVQGL